jgi:general secretion pathway protein K
MNGKNQTGAALMLVLLVTAIIATLAVQFQYAFTLNLSRVGNRWHGAQAHQYLLGAESLAALVLEQDLENESQTDDLTEEWAQEVPPFPTDHGFLEARLEDAQGRFNINNLDGKVNQNDGQPILQDALRFTPPQRQFIRLLQTFDDIEDLEITEQEAIAITEAVIDWIDDDDEAMGFGGAESLFYDNLTPPYQPANQLINSISELRMIRHMTPELYTALEPFLIALPAETDLNLNTVPLKLLQVLNDVENLQPLDASDVEEIITDREAQPFDSLNTFLENPIVSSLMTQPDTTNARLGVASNFFIMHAKASVGEGQIRFLDSLLYRNDEGKARAFLRRYTSY